jgi:tetratricopeptide (TPR) repeat protein
MPTFSPRPALFRLLPVALALVLVSVGAGWWLGQRQRPRPAPTDPRREALSREAGLLRERVKTLRDTPQDRQRLLELLVGLDRKGEAIELLEGLADRDAQRWSLRLMLAELRRDQGDRLGAERELRQILHQRPTQIEALQLMSLLLLEQDRGAEAETLAGAAYSANIQRQARAQVLESGLLLAELRQRRGRSAEAEALYTELKASFPSDQRPPLGLALLRHDLGNLSGALEALELARQRGRPDSPNQATLGRLAVTWRLKASRQAGARSPGVPPSRPSGDGSGPPGP